MKIKVIQPPYPAQAEDVAQAAAFMIQELESCDDSLDLILLPECCNAPCGCSDSRILEQLVSVYTEPLLTVAKETAARCGAVVGINLYAEESDNSQLLRNSTLLFGSDGQLAARYDKQHLPASEVKNPLIDGSYISKTEAPMIAEIDGVRYAFLTCYDVYYTEFINRISMEKPDVILICSLQRGERADILEMEAKTCAFLCNSYVVRSSYFMGEDSPNGGCSMVVAPDGRVLKNFGQGLGSFDCVIDDIHEKYCRANGFGQPMVTNDQFQTMYRAPWSYRACGGGVRPSDKETPFPRLCAHRGHIPVAPENTIPCIAVAVAMGAVEVEIDVRPTADDVLVISHDPHVRRLTDQDGIIQEMTYEELKTLDPGKKFSPLFTGVGYATLDEVFRNFPRRTIFNLHVKPLDNVTDYRPLVRKILETARRYDCLEHFYFASECEGVLEAALELAPEIERCALTPEVGEVTGEMVLETAKKYRCSRFQSLRIYMTDEVIKKAHAAGIRCNLFYSDEPEDAKEWLAKGIDTILTDNYLVVSQGIDVK